MSWTARYNGQRLQNGALRIEINSQAVPDDAIFESWHPQPLYALPDSKPGTMTYLVDRYIAVETVINATKINGGFTGSLTSNGKPVPGVQLFAYGVDDGTLNITATASLTNTVPSGAVNAVIALRINTECDCNGSDNIFRARHSIWTQLPMPQSQRRWRLNRYVSLFRPDKPCR
jgi:hypothetical protein